MLEREELYDAELLAVLCRSPLPGRPVTFPVRGIHRSRQRGSSLEFSEHTEYVPGDELRCLDWRVYAKSDRFYVKRFEDERLAKTLIAVDASASMSYGGSEGSLSGSKYHLAAKIAVSISSALLRQGDAAGVCVAGKEPFFIPARGGMAQMDAILDVLSGTVPSGGASLETLLPDLAERVTRPSALIWIGDLLDEGDETLSSFSTLNARGVNTRIVHVLHPGEVDLPYENSTRFEDLESPSFLVADPEALRRAYAGEMRAFVRSVSERAWEAGIPYSLVRDIGEARRYLPEMLGRQESRAV